MKVIFLGIEGVLNSGYYFDKKYPIKGRSKIFKLQEQKIQLLKKIVEVTDTYIVLCSTWRYGDLGNLKKLLKGYNIYILDKTDDYVYFDKKPKKCKTWYLDKYNNGYTHDIGAEILKYLDEHKDISDYVVVDENIDTILKWIPKSKIVKTALYWGLTESKALNIIKKLKTI